MAFTLQSSPSLPWFPFLLFSIQFFFFTLITSYICPSVSPCLPSFSLLSLSFWQLILAQRAYHFKVLTIGMGIVIIIRWEILFFKIQEINLADVLVRSESLPPLKHTYSVTSPFWFLVFNKDTFTFILGQATQGLTNTNICNWEHEWVMTKFHIIQKLIHMNSI